MYTVASHPVFLILPSRWLVRRCRRNGRERLERFGFIEKKAIIDHLRVIFCEIPRLIVQSARSTKRFAFPSACLNTAALRPAPRPLLLLRH
jgi:hypothetical protein